MRIAVVCERFYPHEGGVERRYWEISRRLARSHEVHVLTMGPLEAGVEDVMDGVRVYKVFRYKSMYGRGGRRPVSMALFFSSAVFQALLRGGGGYDVIDCSSFPYIPSFPAKFFSFVRGTPLILTFHEVWGRYWFEYLEGRLSAGAGMLIERLSSRLPRLIVAVSKRTAQDLVETLGVKPESVVFVPNGVDSNLFKDEGGEKSPYKVLFAGRLVHYKRVEWLIEAVNIARREVPQISLHIVGDGPERKSLESLTKKLGLSLVVKFHGFLPAYKEVVNHMRNASVFVSPSIREGFGTVVLESMAASTPVVITRSPYNASLDFVENGVNGLVVEPNKPKEIAEAIVRLVKDSDFRLRLARNARDTARGYTWDSIAKRMETLYKSVI